MILSLDELRRIHASIPEDTTTAQPHPLSIPTTFPALNDITLMTFNYFDNGETTKSLWIKARFAMNVQVFTLRDPFTPSKALAAWEGTIQLHTPSFTGRYLTSKFPEQEAAARRNLEYFHNELGGLHQTKRQQEQAGRHKSAQQTFAELHDPVHGIKGFGPDLIRDLDVFATQDLGLTDQDLADFVSHPRGAKIIKALNDLYAAKRGQKALALKTKKPVKAPVKMVKSPSEPASRGPDRHSSAIERLRKDNSSDAIQNAFLARMTKR